MNAYCIVVDTRLMASRLPRCLATLDTAIRRFPGRVEVHVVADAASPRLYSLSKRYGARFETIPCPSVGARSNEAVHRNPGETLVFPAPRARLADGWLASADLLLRGQHWDAVLFLPRVPPLSCSLIHLWRQRPPAGTLCVHREWFERIGGFDPLLDEAAGDDLVHRLRACQARVLEVPFSQISLRS
ncbi:hypothetical protein [Litchfieldella xinjiangensis]|uniref:hypothetical protein n=1 Tax=Litchfieldella xinjiangensis TaxID=1166948 RepID=UPI0005BD200C|nr:hypothetical protein [Halomonas xinjiangensis]